MLIDPQGPIGSDHYFHTSVRQSVANFSKITASRTVRLAEWIIDDYCLV